MLRGNFFQVSQLKKNGLEDVKAEDAGACACRDGDDPGQDDVADHV